MDSPLIKIKIRDIVSKSLYNTGSIEWYLKRKFKHAALILSYHRINTKEFISKNCVMAGMYVSDKTFEAHMIWLKKYFEIVSLNNLITKINKNQKWNYPLCAITFDDGWFDNYKFAYPILRKYNIPATIFVVGNRLNNSIPDCYHLLFEIITNSRKIPFNLTGIKQIYKIITTSKKDKVEKARMAVNILRTLTHNDFDIVYGKLIDYCYDRLDMKEINEKHKALSWKELNEMQNHDINFGYHSKSHYMLTHVPIDKLSAEIEMPYKEAYNNGIELSRFFCYPDGQYNDIIIQRLKDKGYKGAVSLKCGLNNYDTNPYVLRRINIHEDVSSEISNFLYLIASKILTYRPR